MTRHFHFFPRQTKDKPWKQRLRERTNRHCAGNHPRRTKADVSPRTLDRHVLEDTSGMDTDGHELVCSKSIHQRSQSTGCVLVRKAPTNPDSQSRFQTGQGRLRWGFKRIQGKVCDVKSTWPGCDDKLGTCHCCNTTPTAHTRIPGRRLSSPTTECILCGGDPPPMTARRTHFSRTWVQGWKGSQLKAIKPSQLDDFCRANNRLQDDSKGVNEQGELQG